MSVLQMDLQMVGYLADSTAEMVVMMAAMMAAMTVEMMVDKSVVSLDDMMAVTKVASLVRC